MQSDIVLLYVAEALGEMNVINFKYVCIIFIMGEKGLCDKRHVLWFKWSTPSRDSLYKGTGNTVLILLIVGEQREYSTIGDSLDNLTVTRMLSGLYLFYYISYIFKSNLVGKLSF